MQSRFPWLVHILGPGAVALVPQETTFRPHLAEMCRTLRGLHGEANSVFRNRAYSIPITRRFVILRVLETVTPLSHVCWKNKRIGIDFA
jgi:hypothetical protein